MLRTDLAAIIGDLPVSFTFAGSTYSGTRAENSETEDLEPGGFIDQPKFELHVALKTLDATSQWVNTFTTEPVIGSLIQIEGRSVAVLNKRRSADLNELILELGPPAT